MMEGQRLKKSESLFKKKKAGAGHGRNQRQPSSIGKVLPLAVPTTCYLPCPVSVPLASARLVGFPPTVYHGTWLAWGAWLRLCKLVLPPGTVLYCAVYDAQHTEQTISGLD